jgi:large subunit ribosomal protein L21
MYAILELNSKQFIVSKGDKILVDFIKNKQSDDTITYHSILAIINDKINIFGSPYVPDSFVKITINKPLLKGKKIRVYKKKRRKGYHKTIGHRQKYTQIEVSEIFYK